MADEYTVSFKVFLQKAGSSEKPEVRRFGVDRDVVCNFTYLKQKLQAVFPALQGKDFAVSWKDGEGDEIIISSDDELMIALTEMQTDVRKLYATVNDSLPKQDSSSASSGRNIHAGVTCDGCNKAVEGFRYKCIQCHDYDLCACCEAKGMHSEHYMIRLPVPIAWRPHFGRRLAHHLSKSSSRKTSCSPPEAPEGGQCPWSGRSGSRHHHSHGGRHGGWLQTLATYLDEWANLPGEGQGESQAAGSSEQKSEASKQEDSHVQYLMNVGQTVANMLDPLGIEVDVEVLTNKGENKKVPKPADEQKTPKENPKPQKVSFAKEEIPKGVAVQKQPLVDLTQESGDQEKENDHSVPKADRGSPETEGWTVLNQGDAQQIQDQSSEATALATVEAIAKAEVDAIAARVNGDIAARASRAAAAAAAAAATTSAATAVPHSGFAGAMPENSYPVCVPPNMGHPPMGTQYLRWDMVPPPAPSIYPSPIFASAPQSQQPPRQQHVLHPNPHIADSVQKMMAMGFSNEGGWLTQLLETKNGDIVKVLDVLQPVKK